MAICRDDASLQHAKSWLHFVNAHSCKVPLQDILATGETQRDLSGNPILVDSGIWLRNQIKNHFKDADIKYIDPSYLIRSIPTTSGDRIYCKVKPDLTQSKSSIHKDNRPEVQHSCLSLWIAPYYVTTGMAILGQFEDSKS